MSRMPPAFVATAVRPRANASSTTRPRPSGHDGRIKRAGAVNLRSHLGRKQLPVVLDPAGQVGDESVDVTACREPLPTTASVASGTSCATSRQAARESVDVLVLLEHPDEHDAALAGTGNERRVGECREIAVGRERRGRRPPADVLDQGGR